MTRPLLFVLVALAGTPALAQFPGSVGGVQLPRRQPVTSPYLNLLRGNGRSFAFNYYQRVRPEQEFRRNAAQFNQSLGQLRQQIDSQQRQGMEGSGLTGTGRVGRFLNLGGYFPGSPGVRGRSGAGLSGSRQPPRRSPRR